MKETTVWAIIGVCAVLGASISFSVYHYHNTIITEKAVKSGLEECPKYNRSSETIWVKNCSEYLFSAKKVYEER